MKTKLIIPIALLFGLVACNQNTEKKAPAEYPINDPQLGNITTDTSTLVLTADEQCFTANVKTDSAFISLKQTDNRVDGRLWYKFAEKDNSKGKVNGIIDNDTLKLNYVFNAEGTTSEMPIKLFYKNGNLYEVHGNKTSEDDHGFIFVKSDCTVF